MTITVQQPIGDLYGPQIIELMRILKIVNHNSAKDFVFDFSNISFAQPLLTLSLAGLIFKLREFGLGVTISNLDNSYLHRINFESGLCFRSETELRNQETNSVDKTYLPIFRFSTSKEDHSVKLRNAAITWLNNLIKKSTGIQGDVFTAVSYLISEMTDNISDHSGADFGWLYAQHYPTKGHIDVCILDTGKSILGSYLDNHIPGIINHTEALSSAHKGKSTKGKERGRGIPTSHRLVIEGLGGKIGIISGDAILRNTEVASLPEIWPGTILALRIPVNPTKFDFYRLIE